MKTIVTTPIINVAEYSVYDRKLLLLDLMICLSILFNIVQLLRLLDCFNLKRLNRNFKILSQSSIFMICFLNVVGHLLNHEEVLSLAQKLQTALLNLACKTENFFEEFGGDWPKIRQF